MLGSSIWIIKNKWDKWFRNIKNVISISIIRLNDKFNLNFTKSNLFFDKVKGLPYGYNFIYGWIDTINNNYPDNLIKFVICYINFLENKLDFQFTKYLVKD